VISVLVTKKSVTPGRPAIVGKDELRKEGKTTENTSINLYHIDFFIIIKKIAKNRQDLLRRPNKIHSIFYSQFFFSKIIFNSNQK